ncbi:MAG: metallophosphoesterase [Bacteroidales bacterium]|nr:metallophosphoesterase [Bacteroidales bacterium]
MKRFLMILAVCFAAAACQPRLVIIHTNDTHSHFDPVRGGERDGLGGIIERAAFVDSIRSVYPPQKVLMVHAGDFNQGTSYHSELGGSLEPKIINAMAYDCITLGNHELDEGIESLAARLSVVKCPVVCANCEFPEILKQYVTPTTVIERGGMRIGIIGMEADIATMVAAPTAQRIRQLDNVEVVNKWAEHLRKEDKCNFVILLSHLGYQEDQDLVPQTKGLNLIIGGHSHTFVDGIIYVKDARGKKVPIITDGCWGLQMGLIKIR